MNKKLLLFDFDGTITSQDSFWHFLFNSFGVWYILKLIILKSPIVLFIIINFRSKSKVKEYLLKVFLKNKTKEELMNLGRQYYFNNLTKILRPKAMQYICKIDHSVYDFYIVSASIDIWLFDFAINNKAKLISTELHYSNNIFQGRFTGENCKGQEKVNRINDELDLNLYEEIIAFGDSKGDREMFQISTISFFKPFR